MHRTRWASRSARLTLVAVVAIALLACLIYLLVLALGGANLVQVGLRGPGRVVVHDPEPWLIVALAAALLILGDRLRVERDLHGLGSRLGETRSAHQEEAEARRHHAEAEDDARRRQQEAEAERDRLREELERESARHARAARAWRSEREFNRDLREQIVHMQRSQGLLGRHDDVREMVLGLTMSLVDAEKGILLSQRDSDGDGRLDLVCHLGFENDPRESALAQRFASEVVKRDTTLREDDRARVRRQGQTAADAEVHNLLAIPIYLLDDFAGVIVCANREGGFGDLDDEVLVSVGDHAGAVLQNSRLHGELRNAYLSTVRLLTEAIELKDPELRGHSDAVSEYVLAVADRLGFEPLRRERLIFASLLHDVGKLGISERILLKPAALSDEERSVMQLHPRIGYQLVRQVPALGEIAPAVLHHHERFDGEGYPARLRGEAIPLEARIISIADTFSAMTSERPYSRARTVEEACAELERCAGEQFDPEIVRLFVEEVRRRPPERHAANPLSAEPELALHRADGEFRLGARAFGMTDSLTMLYSHRHFYETAHAEAQRASVTGRPFAVVVVTLTDLEDVNRLHGYGAGDGALRAAGAAVGRVAADCRGPAFRISGRRLGMIAGGLDEVGAQRAAEKVAARLGELDGAAAGLGILVGSASWRQGESGEQVVERARRAVSPLPAPAGS